ncbi:MAG: cellulase family glycosylhydrolase [Verrucomicrobiota bacterium]
MNLPKIPSRPRLRHWLLAAACLTALSSSAMAALGSQHLLNFFQRSPWNGTGGDTVLWADYKLPEQGGIIVHFAFQNPLIGVDVSDPASPDATGATPSHFGVTSGSGIGVNDLTDAFFNRGEQLSLQADHRFALTEIEWHGYTADEDVHIAWTQDGSPQSVVLTLSTLPDKRIKGSEVICPVPSGVNIHADANTPVRITNVSASTADKDARLRLVRVMTRLVFDEPPFYDSTGTDGFQQMFGVNIAGADFGSDTLPGAHDTDYFYPNAAELDYYNGKGLKLIRLPFRWERLQYTLGGALHQPELDRIDNLVTMAEARGMKVILDMHNYARYYGDIIGSSAVSLEDFEDVWERIALHFKDRPGIYGYGLSNEPNGMGTYSWPDAAQAGTDGVRNVDPNAWVIVAGEHWSSATKWVTANANLDVQDPSNRLIYEAHSYFDNDGNGEQYGTYESEYLHPNRGIYLAEPFVQWLKDRNARGFFGEFGVPPNDPRWHVMLERFLEYLGANGLSATYWAGGRFWNGVNPNVIHPSNNYTVDKPQMSVLEKHYAYGAAGGTPPTGGDEIIIDNASSSGAGITVIGTWQTSTHRPGYIGDNFMHDQNTAHGTKSVLYYPTIPAAATYDVYLRWTSDSNRATNVPVDIIHAGGVDSTTVDQTEDGGEWFPLGAFGFAAGQSGGVQISNAGTDGYVIADAVRFVKTAPTEIIIDNLDLANVTYNGAWSTSTHRPGYHGTNFVHNGNTDQGAKSVVFTPDIPVAGDYEVFTRWTSDNNRATNVPISVTSTTGTTSAEFDQQIDGGQWISLGVHAFAQGTTGLVTIGTTATNGYVIADAVRFVRIDN